MGRRCLELPAQRRIQLNVQDEKSNKFSEGKKKGSKKPKRQLKCHECSFGEKNPRFEQDGRSNFDGPLKTPVAREHSSQGQFPASTQGLVQ